MQRQLRTIKSFIILSLLASCLMTFSLSQAEKIGCDFESECKDLTFDQNWGIIRANEFLKPNAPDYDNTFKNLSGHFVHYKFNVDDINDSRFDFKSIFNYTDMKSSSEQRFLQFYYILLADEKKDFFSETFVG